MKKILAIPTVIIVAMIIAYNVNSEYQAKQMMAKYDQIFYESFGRYPDVITTSSRGDSVDLSGLAEVMSNYNNEKYDAALGDFNEYLSANPDDHRITFYRGVVRLQLKQTDEAISDLKTVTENYEDLKGQAEWYLALAYIKSNQADKAVPLLDAIVARDRGEHSKMSKTVLEQINS